LTSHDNARSWRLVEHKLRLYLHVTTSDEFRDILLVLRFRQGTRFGDFQHSIHATVSIEVVGISIVVDVRKVVTQRLLSLKRSIDR
jgi:hypothetical protein